MQKLQISIPEPCHENWHAMTPTQQGRFCNACAKEVVDFTMMTDTEVLNYFTGITHEKVCGRALPAQLDRVISYPKEPKKRLFWYWNYIVMFFMFFSKANIVKAQGGVKRVTEISNAPACKVGEPVKISSRLISGKVTDIDGNPVPFATIKIKGLPIGLSADENGAYSIKVNPNDVLLIYGAGYKQVQVQVGAQNVINTVLERGTDSDFKEMTISRTYCIKRSSRIQTINPIYVVDGAIVPKGNEINPDDIDYMTVLQAREAIALFGAVGSNGAIVITTRKPKVKVLDTVVVSSGYLNKKLVCRTGGVHVRTKVTKYADIQARIITRLTDSLKIYPNPVQKGTAFSVSLKLKQAGTYSIQVADATGKIVLQKQTNIPAKEYVEQFQTDNRWGSGIYYIRVFDNNNKPINKASFIVQ